MKLPHLEQAEVAEAKIRDYLLSETHPDGKDKAAFFLSFGFSPQAWELLAQALRNHAAAYEVARTTETEHGIKYVVDGVLLSPDRRNPVVRAVWIVDNGEINPRLVSAYPRKR